MPSTFGGYALVDISQEYEERYAYQWQLTPGSPANTTSTRTQMRRYIETRVYQAALPDNEPFPGVVNPDNLQLSDGWRVESVRMTATRATPLTRMVRETWRRKGAWEAVGSAETVDPVVIVQLQGS